VITAPFDYESPTTVEEAVRLLSRTPEAKVLAGGHSLLPLMKLGLAQPAALIDIGRIQALREIRVDADAITVGALATHQSIADNPAIRERLAALAEAAGSVGDLQVRARGTIGGSLAHADPAADEPAPTLAFGATFTAVGPAGERSIAATDFFKDTFETALRPGEILTAIRIPLPPARSGSAYEHFPHPASRFAVVGVAAAVTLGADGTVARAAIAVTGAASAPFRATNVERTLQGTRADAAAIGKAAQQAAENVKALEDLAASAEFRSYLITVYTRRALQRAIERART
jgi:carbon-monoxide dehydrogenase medium subunit